MRSIGELIKASPELSACREGGFPVGCFRMTATSTDAPAVPLGEVVIRTIAMPADANANGDIFGGWLM